MVVAEVAEVVGEGVGVIEELVVLGLGGYF
jgi:hypothetical protein